MPSGFLASPAAPLQPARLPARLAFLLRQRVLRASRPKPHRQDRRYLPCRCPIPSSRPDSPVSSFQHSLFDHVSRRTIRPAQYPLKSFKLTAQLRRLHRIQPRITVGNVQFAHVFLDHLDLSAPLVSLEIHAVPGLCPPEYLGTFGGVNLPAGAFGIAAAAPR